MIKVAITDDHLLVIKGLSELLTLIPSVQLTGSYMTLEETGKGLQKINADVLLLDLNLPDVDGMAYCKELKKIIPHLK